MSKNYTLSEGMRRNRIVRFIQWFFFLLAIVFSIALLFTWFEWKDAQVMSIQYCWDSNGDHYVAPDERCGN